MHANGKRRRRRHSESFKAAAIAACRVPGASVSAVALERQLNANLLRKWVKDARAAPVPALPRMVAEAEVVKSLPAFVPVTVETRDERSREDRPIRVHIRKGRSRITIEWPASAAASCAGWLRELIG